MATADVATYRTGSMIAMQLPDLLHGLTGVGLLFTDRDLRITGWNAWFEVHTGRTAAAVLGQSLFGVFPDLERRGLSRSFHRALDGEAHQLSQRLHQYLFELPLAGHPAFACMQQSAQIAPLVEAGEILGTVTLVNDVTDRTADEKELRQRIVELERAAADRERAQAALREADRRKDQFLAMLAHELRNPLAPIANAVQLLPTLTGGDARVDWACGVIRRQLAHMTSLVDDLLDVSRITQNKIQLRRTPVLAHTVAERAVETSRPLIAQRRHHLEVDIAQSPLWLEADAARLVQALTNLLNNAAKYTPEGGRITLGVAGRGQRVEFSVRDDGIGIEPGFVPHVFELFSQADESMHRSDGGLGVGLTLVSRLVQMHGGEVRCESEGVGRGATFIILLPQCGSPEPIEAGTSGNGEGAVAQRVCVLLVDDNVDALETLAAMFEREGHEVHTATRGHDALNCFREHGADAVVVDIGLPDLSGLDVVRRIREMPSGARARVVALSGYGQVRDIERSKAAGCDAHLVKPVSYERLWRTIAQ